MVSSTQNQSIVSLFSSRTPSQAASTQATITTKAANTTPTTRSRPRFLTVLLRSLACFAA
jgi:hypothetical protein